MKSVEVDAKERAEDRRQRKEIAERHKTEGNKAFRNNDYEKALICYNKVIYLLKICVTILHNAIPINRVTHVRSLTYVLFLSCWVRKKNQLFFFKKGEILINLIKID